jgi:hypothetical protein
MEAQINMRRYVTGRLELGDRGNNPLCTRSSEFIRRNIPASWRIYKKSRSSESSISKARELRAYA